MKTYFNFSNVNLKSKKARDFMTGISLVYGTIFWISYGFTLSQDTPPHWLDIVYYSATAIFLLCLLEHYVTPPGFWGKLFNLKSHSPETEEIQ